MVLITIVLMIINKVDILIGATITINLISSFYINFINAKLIKELNEVVELKEELNEQEKSPV